MKEKTFPIVTLCGSSTQKEDWERYQKQLTMKGYCVLTINIYLGREVKNHNKETPLKQLLKQIHRQKIRMADIIAFIPKPNGELGRHTLEELTYAKLHTKPIIHVETLLQTTNPSIYNRKMSNVKE